MQALERLRIKRFILDGEMVALDERGRLLAQRQRRINKRLAMVSPLAAGGCVSVGPRYRDLRGPIAGEAVVTPATPEYPFRLSVASLTRTR